MNEVKIKGKVHNIKKVDTKTGTNMTRASLGISRKDKKSGEWNTEWFNIVAFGPAAETLSNTHDKSQVIVTGYLKQSSWTDKDGNKKSDIQIVANSIEQLADTETAVKRSVDTTQADFNDIPF